MIHSTDNIRAYLQNKRVSIISEIEISGIYTAYYYVKFSYHNGRNNTSTIVYFDQIDKFIKKRRNKQIKLLLKNDK